MKKDFNPIKLIKNNWKTPAEGRFISLKEIFSLAVGGIGVKFIVFCVSNMIITIGNSLLGNTIGIEPGPMYVIYALSILASFPLTWLRAKMIDASKSIKGKYRPYILTMGIPTVILGIGFIWAPYENMSPFVKCLTVLLFNIGFQFFYNFLLDANDSIINVLSPNSIERTDVYAVKSVIENISPSIAGIFLPIAAKLITGDDTLYDLRVYRYLYPPMLIVGFFVSLIIYVNTEERIIQPKNHAIKMSFWDSLRSVARNKYFWIISLAGWIGFLEGSFGKILEWMYNYQGACTAAQYSVITAIAGNASLWPNLFAPILIRRFGKKKVLIFSNIMNIIFIALMLPIVKLSGGGVIWVLLIFIFINQLLTSCGHFMNPSLNADIRDYQQYISGERIDGMFSAIGLIGSVITLATSSVLPFIYKKAGLNEQMAVSLGYSADNVYDVLYNTELFQSICSILIIASVIGAALNVIPFFFYDLTETKQKAMAKVLRIRAYFEDDLNGNSSPEQEKEVMEIIISAREFADKKPLVIRKGMSRKDKKAILSENQEIEISSVILGELNYFNSPEGLFHLEYSNALLAHDKSFDAVSYSLLVRALPQKTIEQKEFRSKMLAALKDYKISQKTASSKNYIGMESFSESILTELFEISDKLAIDIGAIQKKLKTADKNADIEAIKAELKSLRKEQKLNESAIKTAQKKNILYNRVNKPIFDAQKTIARYESYQKYMHTL